MRIAVVGIGALGSLFAGYLARCGEDVSGVDVQPEIISAIRESGVRIKELEGEEIAIPLRVALRPEEIGQVDLVIFLTKSGQTQAATQSARCLFGDHTVALTLQNGLGNPEAIGSILGEERVLVGVTNQGSTLLRPGSILHGGRGETVIGERQGTRSERADHVASAFKRAGFPTQVSARIQNDVWGKLIVNVGINALTAITRLRNGVLVEHPETREILRRAVEETIRVADRKGIRFPHGDAVKKVEDVCRASKANFSSMLQDVLQRRETEADFINGAVVREGEELGIETPVNRLLTALVKTLEKTYDQRAEEHPAIQRSASHES
jgi:2-dehydropantoate 2-reductase